jgi:DHA1 family bicyclomycin/chloramphenicol resistance-like MFS transporter
MNKHADKKISFAEFIGLMALYVALMAMTIDTILPALLIIGEEFNVVKENETQYIVSLLFLGFTFGQIIYGPISDSFGRRFTIYIGLVIFIIGNILSLTAESFSMMLFGRFLQGFGAASPRITSIAIIRDLYKGREMARVMSFIMTIFIIIPVIAPSIGQAILLVASWRIIFIIFLICALIAMVWTYMRLPETLKKKDIRPFNLPTIWNDFRKVVSNKITLGYTICAGLVFGALIGYLNSSRQIFQDYFAVGKSFPLYFSISALSIGGSSIFNSMIVRRYGMKLICHYALIVTIIMSAIFVPLSLQESPIPIWMFMIYMIITFFCMGLLFGNLNALAMEPMAHYAGIASAVVGSLSSGISAITGTLIGQAYNNSLTPILTGFLILSLSSFSLLSWLKKYN